MPHTLRRVDTGDESLTELGVLGHVSQAQTVTVPGSNTAEIVLRKFADSLKTILLQRHQVAEDIERMLDDHPLLIS